MKRIPNHLFINLYNKGLSDSQIAKELDSSLATIWAKRKAQNLPINLVEGKVKLKELQRLHDKGYSDIELCKYFNCSDQSISKSRRNLGLVENKPSNFIKELTSEEHEILLGLILGDGHLIKESYSIRAGTSGTIVHGLDQKDYIYWMQEKLSRLTTPVRLESYFCKTKKKIIKRYACNINTHSYLNRYYEWFYDHNKVKYITKEVIEMITPLSLAIWFMDDGTKATCGGYYLCTNCFSKEEQENILPILKRKFNLKVSLGITVRKQYMIYISATSAKQFERIVNPYIIESMKYKIHNKEYKYKKVERKYLEELAKTTDI